MLQTSDRDRQILADLANHPGWTVLRERVKADRDDYMVELARKIYGNPNGDYRDEARFKSGFYRGMFYLLNQPVFEKKAFERAMAQSEGVEDA